MCGIVGFNWEDRILVRKLLKAQEHRGPDGQGIFSDRGITLGHRRLAIIDLSKRGKQPMSNEDESIWISFNGEIYNFNEIKRKLKQKHKFVSGTDTEVLIHLYEEQGEKMLEHLEGMFAFCIYDSRKRKLFLARDHAGIKPLYYWNKNGKFAFASELNSLLLIPEIKREVNNEALSSYFAFRANVTEETMIKGVYKLLPGSALTFELMNKKQNKWKWWDIGEDKIELDVASAAKEVREQVSASVKEQLVSDVPYGAFLSGGIDSGAVVALMKTHTDKVNTFSVGFEEKEHSETKEAKELAEKLGTNHHELVLGKEAIKFLPEICKYSDEPIADPTCVPTFLLSRYTKKWCTVVLTGEGADEIFGGYPQYKFMRLHNSILKRVPNNLKALIPWAVKNTPRGILNKGFKYAEALGDKGIERFARYALADKSSGAYFNQVGVFNDEERRELMKQKAENIEEKYSKELNNGEVVEACQRFEFKHQMVDNLLMKVDKMGMASAIEGRVPYLNSKLIKFAFALPTNMRLKGFSKEKFILREAFRGVLPSERVNRKKRHFFVPVHNWLDNELSSLKENLLDKNYLRRQNLFNSKYLDKMEKGYKNSRLFYARQLWELLMFQIWHKRVMENENVKL